jgi:probable F420-dependent oxidoreductase
MKYGIAMFVTDYSMRPDEIARAVEERGFESLFFPEHTHIPASRRSRNPYQGEGELPPQYFHALDLFAAMATAAAATKRLKLASGVCLVIEHDPIVLAKQIASVDFLSGGRVIFGVGAGWNAEEMENHGTAFKSRWKLLRERVEAMKQIWTMDAASYHGELVKFDSIWSWPKPAQKPHPPILLGSNGPRAFERVVRYCDGWLPSASRGGDLAAQVAELHRVAQKGGRDPKTISVTVFAAPPDKRVLESYEAFGAERAVLFVPPAGPDQVLPKLDQYAKLIAS